MKDDEIETLGDVVDVHGGEIGDKAVARYSS